MHKHSGKCRRFCAWCFVQSLAFPIEHFVWEKLPGFVFITHALGL